MEVLPLRFYPDPVLREKCDPVVDFDEQLATFLDNMGGTMYEEQGIGLAAPQVGVLQRVTVIDVSPDQTELLELINPSIVERGGRTSSEEGCLSIPDYRETVARDETILVRAQDRSGAEFELQAEGLLAICIQHELDHLDGVLFIDHLSRLKRELFKRWFKRQLTAEHEYE